LEEVSRARAFPLFSYLLDVGLGKGGLVAQEAVLGQLIAELLVDGEEGLMKRREGGA
jgi:hypothetical protein